MATYQLKVVCTNCGHKDTANVPVGTPFYSATTACARCGCNTLAKSLDQEGPGRWRSALIRK